MKMQTYGTTIVASDIEITDEEYKELASRYTRALAESMANTKQAILGDVFTGLHGTSDYEIEVDFNE
jgi:L-aminopeptidase/D-esterase-like protein